MNYSSCVLLWFYCRVCLINSSSAGVKNSFQTYFSQSGGLVPVNFASAITRLNLIKLLFLIRLKLLFMILDEGNLIIMHHFNDSYQRRIRQISLALRTCISR